MEEEKKGSSLDPQDSPVPYRHYVIALICVVIMCLFSGWLVSYLLP